MKLKELLFSISLLALGSVACSAATATWTGAADGTTWKTPGNWAGGVLPDDETDTLITGGTGTQITLTGSATIRSLNCSKTLVLKDADLYLLGGHSTISGTLWLTNAGSISVDNPGTTLAISGQGSIDGGLYANDGAGITVTSIRSITNYSYTTTYRAYGEGSYIQFTALTNMSAAPNTRIYLEAYEGASVDAHAVTKTANGIQIYADGENSTVDVSGISGTFASKSDHAVRLDSRNGAAIYTGVITQLDNAEVLIRGNADLPTSALVLATNCSITVDDASPSFANLRDVPNTELLCQNAGVISLPKVTKVPVSSYTISWESRDTGSLIEFPALTNLQVAANSRLYVEAYDGGTVDLHAVTVTTNAVQAYAYEPDSLVDLSGLPGRWASKGGHQVVADAQRGGTVLIPKVTELDNALLRINAATVPTAQIKLMTNCNLQVEDMSLTMAALKDIPDTEILVRRAGMLTLPAVTSMPVKAYTISWRVEDALSSLALPALTTLNVAANSRLYLEAYEGGQLDVRNVTQTVNAVQAYAYDAGSVINLSGLSGKWASASDHDNRADARDGGSVLIPNVTELENTVVYIRGVGQVTSSQITSLRDCSIQLYAASPDFRSVRSIPNTEVLVFDAGVARLTNVTQVDISKYTITWKAQDAGSLLDLSSLRQINVGLNSRLFVEAYEGGRVDLSRLDSLTTGAVQFWVEDAQSVIDLRGLSSFINIGNHDALLQAKNGGAFLLNDQAFILSGVKIEMPTTHPVLPSQLAASSQTTLYGKPWRSYWVERRYMSPVATDWMFTARVPLTNSFQPFTMYTPTNVVYKVWEFVADQPIVDPMPYRPQNKFGVVLYGQPGQTYQLQSTRNFTTPWALESTVTMTNSFRILPPAVMSENFKFYRGKRQ